MTSLPQRWSDGGSDWFWTWGLQAVRGGGTGLVNRTGTKTPDGLWVLWIGEVTLAWRRHTGSGFMFSNQITLLRRWLIRWLIDQMNSQLTLDSLTLWRRSEVLWVTSTSCSCPGSSGASSSSFSSSSGSSDSERSQGCTARGWGGRS